MKKLDTSQIITGVGYPPSKKGFDFLYLSNQEILNALAQAVGGEAVFGSEAYVLFGCVKTDLGAGNFSISYGYIYDAVSGEVYLYPGTGGLAVATAIILNLDTTAGVKYPVAYNPVLFTDNTSKNVHVNNQLIAVDGALGSGLLNFDDLIFINGDWIENDAYTAYRRDRGIVYLNGLGGATGTAIGSVSTSLVLPLGFRPSSERTLKTVPFYDGVGTFPISGSGTLTIATDGKVTHSALTGAGTARFISLQGISFKI